MDLEQELAGLTGRWSAPSSARTYRNDDRGRKQLEEEVRIFGRHGYTPTASSATEGHVNIGRTVAGASLTGGLTLLFGGSRTGGVVIVTYSKAVVAPAPPPATPTRPVRRTPQEFWKAQVDDALAAGGMHGAYMATNEFGLTNVRAGAHTWASGKSTVTVTAMATNSRSAPIRDLAVEFVIYGHGTHQPAVVMMRGDEGVSALLPQTRGSRKLVQLATTGPMAPGQQRRVMGKWINIEGTRFAAFALARCAASGAEWEPVVQANTEAVLRYYLWGAAGQPPEPGPAPELVPESSETPPGDDQTKLCPDCAETVKAAARIVGSAATSSVRRRTSRAASPAVAGRDPSSLAAPPPGHALAASSAHTGLGAVGAEPLSRRAPFDDPPAVLALERRELQPRAGAARAGECQLARGLASGLQ